MLLGTPEGLIVAGFGGLIVVGAILLSLPMSQKGNVGVLDALFTATSAACVTGLIVVDTGTDYTIFGQLVILVLIQMGGIGVMSFAALAFQVVRRRLSLRAQAALSSSMLQRDVGGDLKGVLRRILLFVVLTEGAGALVLFAGMAPGQDLVRAAYSAVFHAISAFCNAGFSVYTDSLSGLRGNPTVMTAVMLLIFLGGIGHPVAVDLWQNLRLLVRRRNTGAVRLELGSTVALRASLGLTLGGAVLLLILGLTPAETTWGARVSSALFQSVTARTAGFNTIAIGSLPLGSIVVLALLMFIGGSPGSCAGGIKTTTFTLWLARLRSLLQGTRGPRLSGRYIPGDITRRASIIIGLSVLWNLVGVMVLLATETGSPGVGLHDVLFEQVSAFGTVGLSTGLTPRLTGVGKLWIIATMFVGRLGPLTLGVLAFSPRVAGLRYPEGRIMVG
jgi:trk system potassium uptake protein TrkH